MFGQNTGDDVDYKTLLVSEFIIASGINCWGALKEGIVPFPGTIARSAAAFGILGVVGMWQPKFAGLLGAGFLLALIVKQAQSGWTAFGAMDPTDGTYFYLKFNQTVAGAASPAPPATGVN